MSNPLRCVLDTSVSIKHFIPDPLSPKVDGLLAHLANPQTEIFVPDLFYIESLLLAGGRLLAEFAGQITLISACFLAP